MTRDSWGRFLARTAVLTLVLSGGVFVAVRQAMAVQGGATRNSLAFAGTLGGARTGEMVTMTFEFQREGVTAGDAGSGAGVLCAPAVPTVVGSGGAVQVAIPLDGCPGTLFDGSDVVFRVRVNGATVGDWRPVHPVPYARYADSVGTPDCPVGYDRDGREAGIVLCRKCRGPGRFESCYDDVVRVGQGASAFWIDRYEASVWMSPTGVGTPFTMNLYGNAPAELPRNGQWSDVAHRRPLAFALSREGVMPAYEVTWFQANEACRASGKRLPDDAEWLAAAEGTPDPPTTEMGDGREGRCLTNVVPRRMSGGRGAATGVIGCESVWGVQDMIGNVREWTNEWAADPGLAGAVPTRASRTAWPAEYRGDESVASDSNPWTGGVYGTGLPAATIRGGSYESGTTAGTFAYSLGFAPSGTNDDVGFRCVIPR